MLTHGFPVKTLMVTSGTDFTTKAYNSLHHFFYDVVDLHVGDIDYSQVAFNTPFVAEQQTYSAFLAEPRTYGITVRAGF